MSYAVNAFCSLYNQLQASVSETRLSCREPLNKPTVLFAAVCLTQFYSLLCTLHSTAGVHISVSLPLSPTLSHTHTRRHKSHRIWQKMGFLWRQCGMTHRSPHTCPLADAPTHNIFWQARTTCTKSPYDCFIYFNVSGHLLIFSPGFTPLIYFFKNWEERLNI